jgi:hypothetical protein
MVTAGEKTVKLDLQRRVFTAAPSGLEGFGSRIRFVEIHVGPTEERSDDVPASVIYGELWIAGAALRLIRPTQ